MNKTSTLTIGIPTFNEKNTITSLLNDIMQQQLPPFLRIKEVIVSDCSYDETPALVESYSSKLPIRLFHHGTRLGLNYAINEIFQSATSDILVYVNADTKLHHECVARLTLPLVKNHKVGLTSANMVPVCHKNGLVQRGHCFGAMLMTEIRRNVGKLIFHGRAFAIRTHIAREIEIPSNTLDQDTFICYTCFDMGWVCEFVHDAVCYYNPPSTIRDFVLPNRIYVAGLRQLKKYRPEWFQKYKLTELSDPRILRIFIKHLASDTLGGLAWATLKLVERFYPLKGSEINVLKPQAITTKVPFD